MADHLHERLGSDAIDLDGPGLIEFDNDTDRLEFIAVRAELDCRHFDRDGRAIVEFTWASTDDGDQVSGRGWATHVDESHIEGELFFHLGDESSFQAKRTDPGRVTR